MATAKSQKMQPVQKSRELYKQAQIDVNQNRLNRITEERMKKRYSYIDKQVKNKETHNDKQNIDQLKFYRNKFHSLVVLVSQSVRQSYNRNKFENQVKNILKENWSRPIANANLQSKNIPRPKQSNQKQQALIGIKNKNQKPIIKKAQSYIEEVSKGQKKKSFSPLSEFFDKNKQTNNINFKSLNLKVDENPNKSVLKQIKQTKKRTTIRNLSNISIENTDSDETRLRDLRRQNQQLQKIVQKRNSTIISASNSSDTIQKLKQQIHYYQQANKQLKQNGQIYSPMLLVQKPYLINYQKNNVDDIQFRNMQKDTSRRGLQELSHSKSRSRSKIFVKEQQSKQLIALASNKIQREKEVYLNLTPQILFENQLIKVMVIRHPMKVTQVSFAKNKNLIVEVYPQQILPNEQTLQLIILNKNQKQVKSEDLFVDIQFHYQKEFHEVKNQKMNVKNFSQSNYLKNEKKNDNKKNKNKNDHTNIAHYQIVRIKLLDKKGYNQQIIALVKAEYFYFQQSGISKSSVLNKRDHKISNNFEVAIKLPVTFIQLSARALNEGEQKNQKITIKPNELYNSFEHIYMNTNLPLKKSFKSTLRESAVIYGRSYVHGSLGTLIEGQIALTWFEKKGQILLTIQTIQCWIHLIAYLFMDVQQQQQDFLKQFRKPSMHVFFNLQQKKFYN